MVANIRVQVGIQRDTLLPRDLAINTWHFRSGTETPASCATQAVVLLTAFYQAIDGEYSTLVASPALVKCYNLLDAEPRTPILEDEIIITTSTGESLPAEVAVCMSFRALLVSGLNPARRRGRLFIGPLDGDVSTTGTGDMRVSAGTRSTIIAAAEAVATDGILGDAVWAVFSPTTAGTPPYSQGALDSAFSDVVAGYVDDAFDTVRSRGLPATARNSWAL